MNKNPKIMVFKLKELIYTGIFLLLGILLILLFVWMFGSEKSKEIPTAATPDTAVDAGTMKSSGLIAGTGSSKNAETTANNSVETGSAETESTKTDSAKEPDIPKASDPSKEPSLSYQAGIYTSSLLLNNSALEIEVRVSSDRITSVTIKNMDTAIQTMYPLIENAMKDLEQQIIRSQSLQQITYTDDCKYTYLILLDGIKQALAKASLSNA